jgi:hypothetical protein
MIRARIEALLDCMKALPHQVDWVVRSVTPQEVEPVRRQTGSVLSIGCDAHPGLPHQGRQALFSI